MFRTFFKNKQEHLDKEKFIYDLYYHHVYKTAYFIIKDPHMAQDILQEAFIKIFKNLDKLHDESKMKAWISQITTRTAIDFIRKENRWNGMPIEDVNHYENGNISELASTVEKEVERSITIEQIQQQMLKLTPSYRTVLYLKYIQDLKDQEIADYLQIKVGTVKSRLHRAKRQLKEYIKKTC